MSALTDGASWERVSHIVRTVRASDGSGGFEVATVPLYQPRHADIAQLIATAPQLLEALTFAIRFFDQLTPADAERMRAVIAKATHPTP